jgi:hypothetical protein
VVLSVRSLKVECKAEVLITNCMSKLSSKEFGEIQFNSTWSSLERHGRISRMDSRRNALFLDLRPTLIMDVVSIPSTATKIGFLASIFAAIYCSPMPAVSYCTSSI